VWPQRGGIEAGTIVGAVLDGIGRLVPASGTVGGHPRVAFGDLALPNLIRCDWPRHPGRRAVSMQQRRIRLPSALHLGPPLGQPSVRAAFIRDGCSKGENAGMGQAAGQAISPGMGLLGYGYDVFASPYCVQMARKGWHQDQPPGETPLIDNLNAALIQRTILGHQYEYPAMVGVHHESPSTLSKDIYGRTVEEYLTRLTAKARIGADIAGFSGELDSFGIKLDYRECVFGEASVVRTALSLTIPNPTILRRYLKPQVHEVLAKYPDRAIGAFGTHLVGGVVVGGRSVLRQYAERSRVTDDTKWRFALQASYAGITTAGVAVDSEVQKSVDTFQAAREVQVIGGAPASITSKADLDTWVKTVDDAPAIIEFTHNLIPLWQLLDPDKEADEREALRTAIVEYARLFQAGALLGGNQDFTSRDLTAPLARNMRWGNFADGQDDQFANGEAWSDQYDWGYSYSHLATTTGAERKSLSDLTRYAVFGGEQRSSNDDGTKPPVVAHPWGTQVHPATGKPLKDKEVLQGKAWTPDYGWGYSTVHLYLAPIDAQSGDGWVVVGGQQKANNDTSSAAWEESLSWGQPIGRGVRSQLIAQVRMHSEQWGWGNSAIYLHLRRVLPAQDFTEITEQPVTADHA
jgi:hypothetical protein